MKSKALYNLFASAQALLGRGFVDKNTGRELKPGASTLNYGVPPKRITGVAKQKRIARKKRNQHRGQ